MTDLTLYDFFRNLQLGKSAAYKTICTSTPSYFSYISQNSNWPKDKQVSQFFFFGGGFNLGQFYSIYFAQWIKIKTFWAKNKFWHPLKIVFNKVFRVLDYILNISVWCSSYDNYKIKSKYFSLHNS